MGGSFFALSCEQLNVHNYDVVPGEVPGAGD